MKIGALLLFVLIVFVSCGKDPSGIPDVPVNFFMRLDHPNMRPINTPGGSVEISGYGVAGLIIYKSFFEGYLAYDRCSTVNPERRCIVKVDSTGITATDPCSKAVFSLEDGAPQKPPGEMPLKKYSVSISNNTIYVIN